MSKTGKQATVGPLEIAGGVLSSSRATHGGGFVFLTGQFPMRAGAPMTTGSVEEHTCAVLHDHSAALTEAGIDVEVETYRPQEEGG